ncbi:energy transducer TonB [Thermomonas alba]|uniref:energy transducer TonB n=1 Tax=Thermomonas alba TaxID=2888525 RepID=UPI001F03D031|nr:energy transducer TonB [Thermomonas alba]
MTAPAPPSPRRFLFARSPLVKLVALAFAAGLLLFVLVWLNARQPKDFYRTGDAPANATLPEALPAPLPPDVVHPGTDGNVSGLRLDSTAPAASPPPASRAAPPAPPSTPNSPPPASAAAAGSEQSPPVPVDAPPPRYPQEALRMNIGGTVKVRVTVAPDGRVDRLELAESSGNRDLDRAALEAVRRWTFRPALGNGQPVQAEVVVPIQFDPNR